MDRVVDVYLIRHGITLGNMEKRYIGWSDLPLHEEGRKEVAAMKRLLPHVDALWSSDRSRCVETAEILFPFIEAEQTDRLREIHFGEWEQQTYSMLKNDPHYQKWIVDPSNYVPPNGESYLTFQHRVKNWLRYFLTHLQADSQLRTVGVVTHGGPVRELMHHLHSSSTSPWNWRIEPGEGYHLTLQKEGERKWNLLQAELITANPNG